MSVGDPAAKRQLPFGCGILSANRVPLLSELCSFLPLWSLTNRHRCDMPVRWSHLSTADSHFVLLSSTTSVWICLYRSLSDSSAGFSRRFRSRSSAHAGWVGWKCRMRPTGMKRPLALVTAFVKVFSACSTVLVSPASARYSCRLQHKVPSPLS